MQEQSCYRIRVLFMAMLHRPLKRTCARQPCKATCEPKAPSESKALNPQLETLNTLSRKSRGPNPKNTGPKLAKL